MDLAPYNRPAETTVISKNFFSKFVELNAGFSVNIWL